MEITIPGSVAEIADYAFYCCKALTSLTIPYGVSEIGSNAFYQCTSLKEITIPKSVTSIGKYALGYLLSLTDIYYGGTEAEWETLISNYTNKSALDSVNIHFVASSIEIEEVTDTIYVSDEFTIGATFTCTESYEFAVPLSWEVSDNSGLELGTPSIIYLTDGKTAIVSLVATALKTGSYTVTVTTNDGASDSINIEVEEVIASLTPEPGYEFAELTKVRCEIFLNKEINFDSLSESEVAQLYNYETDEFISEAEIVGMEGVDNFGAYITFTANLDTSTKYYVVILADSIEFTDGTSFSGIQDKDVWSFTTVPIEYTTLINGQNLGNKVIPDYLYSLLYGPKQVDELKENNPDGSTGICAGICITVAAWNMNPSLFKIDSLLDINSDTMISEYFSFNQYAELCQLYAYGSKMSEEAASNKNQYSKLYNAILNYENGTGNPILISIYRDNGVDTGTHAVLPVGIMLDDDSKVEIAVYDCNKDVASAAGYSEYYKYTSQGYITKLTLYKENGEICGWEYADRGSDGDYTIKFYTVSSILDPVYMQKEPSNLLTSELLEDLLDEINCDTGTDISDETSLYLYWIESDSYTRSATDSSESAYISLTDGYIEYSADAPLNSDVTLDLDSGSVTIVLSETSDYTVSQVEMDDDFNEWQTTVDGSAFGTVTLVNTDDGLILTSNDLTDITVTDTENDTTETYTISTDKDSVLIGQDENGDRAFYVDTDDNGSYETKLGEENADISSCTITLSQLFYTFDGTAKKPVVTVTDGTTTLVEGTDYTVSYSNNVYVGTATVTITGIENYTGTATATFLITSANTDSDSSSSSTTVKEGLTLDSDGIYRYYQNGVFAENYAGVVEYDGGYFFVANGLLCSDAHGLNLYGDTWYFLAYGQVQTQYTGFALYDGEWFYITDGVLDINVNGLMTYDGEQFLFAEGHLLQDYSGLWLNSSTIGGDDQWYFIACGMLQNVSQVAMYDGEWFVVKDGVLDTSYNGTIEYDGATFNVKNGQLYN